MAYYLLLFLIGKMSPGPNFIFSTTVSLLYGFKKAFFVILGIVSGSVVWSFFVYNFLVYDFKLGFLDLEIISTVGAFYLIIITILSFFLKKKISKKESSIKKISINSRYSYFLTYLLAFTNCLLNPEIFVFYILIYNGYYNFSNKNNLLLLVFIFFAMIITFTYFTLLCYYISKLDKYVKKYQNYFLNFSRIVLVYISITILNNNLSNKYMEKIEIVKYNPIWKEIYKKEAKKIEIALEDNLMEIHHFGSTSVEDLYAKPKIDILAIVNDIEKINTVSLEKIGFKNRGEVIKTGRYFSKKEPKVHLHIFEKGNFNIERNLRFRNILRKNEKIRKEYQDLKINLAKKYKDGIDYIKNKTDFIEKVLRDEK